MINFNDLSFGKKRLLKLTANGLGLHSGGIWRTKTQNRVNGSLFYSFVIPIACAIR